MNVSKYHAELSKEEKELFEKNIIGRKVKFLLMPGILTRFDYLCLDKESWALLRDCGIFPGDYVLRVKLNKIINTTKNLTIDLYPYRDIVVT